MRITSVNIPKSADSNDGIGDIKMDKLGPVVLIAGKNGAGKTRIIRKIVTSLARQIQRRQFSHLFNKNQIDEIEVDTISGLSETPTLNFVPKTLIIADHNKLSNKEKLDAAAKIDEVGVSQLPKGVFAKIQVIQDRWYSATHQHSLASEHEKEKAIDDYKRLANLILIFLNTKLGRTIDDETTLFNFALSQSNLSDGQKILLQFCVAIFSQETKLKDLIIILDEPENHLHPSVIIETIERIQQCVTNGQIWIATHSVPLLAHFDPSNIWFVENNTIKHAGKTPEKVLQSLLGGDDEVAKLQDFISLPSQFASMRYAVECLFEPAVVNTGSNDPQTYQIRTDLLTIAGNRKLRVLDYGAGKGRLIANIAELDETNEGRLIESLDYIAYDEYSNDKVHCETALTKAYGKSDGRYFNDMNSLLSKYNKGSFDVVIMCNVLHEIDPKDWLELFRENGVISKLLTENGVLLLVEDQQIPVGEKAYQKGFLVLDTPQLRELFKIPEQEVDFGISDQKNDGRLKSHRISKKYLVQIDKESRIEAIQSMSDLARKKIQEIRRMDQNYKNGKLHGFWTQQFANAQLNLAELTT